MKLINPKSPNARLAIAGAVIEADAKGVVEVKDEDVAASLLKSGYMLLEKFEADQKKEKVTAKQAQQQAENVSKEIIKKAEEDAKAAAAEVEDVEVEEDAPKEAENEGAPPRGWSRKAAPKKGAKKG